MLLIVARAPSSADALSRAAPIAGLIVADLQRRLAGVLPRVLLLDASADKLRDIGAKLNLLGFLIAVVDPTDVPTDDQRIVPRSLVLGTSELVTVEGVGAETRRSIPASAIDLFQRGARATRETKTTKTSERKFALGRAVVSGGLVMTKKVERTDTSTVETREPFVLVQRNDGGPDMIIYEKRLDFRFLGAQMQPTSHGNLERVLANLRALAPTAPLDDRVQRPGFVTGLPPVGVEPVDLALHLVRVARALEAKRSS